MLPDGVKCTLHIKIKVKPNNFYSFTVHLWSNFLLQCPTNALDYKL
jgi:hypothetical protein